MNITSILFIIVQVIILDAILSIDNAAALGAIASKLPKEQQHKALRAGLLGAYVGRGTMLFLAGIIISFPILKLVGAGYLLWLVGKYFWDLYKGGGEEDEEESRFAKNAGTFWKTVLMIELADLAFSVDNVLAVIAISSHIIIIIIGVCISILIMRFAAGLFIKLIEFEPLLNHAAYVLIFAIACELILKFFHIGINDLVQFVISMIILMTFLITGQIKKRLWTKQQRQHNN